MPPLIHRPDAQRPPAGEPLELDHVLTAVAIEIIQEQDSMEMPPTHQGKPKEAASEQPSPVDAYVASRIEEGALWRLDPAESFSDWTIQVRRPSGSIDEYHIHKTHTSFGARASKKLRVEYTQDFVEKEVSSSTYEFSDEIADLMPTFLDYLYTGSIEMTLENVLPMHTLADYLDVVRLRDEVRGFFESYPLDQIHTCYDVACRHFGEQDFQKHLQKRLAKYINGAGDRYGLPKASSLPLWRVVDATFLQSLWLLLDPGPSEVSQEMSRIVAAFCEHQETQVIEADLLLSLTDGLESFAADVAPLIIKIFDAVLERMEANGEDDRQRDEDIEVVEERRSWILDQLILFVKRRVDVDRPRQDPLLQNITEVYPALLTEILATVLKDQRSPRPRDLGYYGGRGQRARGRR